MSTIVHDTTEALCLCQDHSLYLKPIAKMTVSVALPQLKTPGKSISNWEVMERVKAMVAPEQFSALRISKSTMDFIRFEGEVENKGVVKVLRERLDGKSIKLSGFTDILKVRAVENKVDFPTKYDWDSFFRDAEDMNEAVPGERPDTIHLEGLPCRWFSQKDSPHPDRPNEETLAKVFQSFGKVRNVDIPMLDPYREEMLDKNFNTFSFGGHLNFEAYVQYQEYQGFIKAMDTLRGMKLMLKGEDGKAVACNIKVAFDKSKHLSEVAVKRRQQERLKLQELERQREEQKRQEKEEEERRKEEERYAEEERQQKEQEEEEKERRREERIRKKEQKQREREERRSLKKAKRQQEEEQRRLQMKIATEERRLLLAQRNLESIRLIAELLARAKALKQQQQEAERAERQEAERQELARQQEELSRLAQLEARRRRQEEELRRVEAEKERALELQRKEKELRDKLLGNLLKKGSGGGGEVEDQALHREKEDSSGLVGSDVLLGLLLAPEVVSRAKAAEGEREKGGLLGQQPPVKASVVRSKVSERKKRVSSSSGARGERRGEDRKRRDREPYKEERRDGRERGGSRERARERRSSSQERRRRRRRSRTRSRRRDSRSRRRSHSHSSSHRGGSRRRSHSRRRRSSRSTSSSRDRSRSSRGRSYSGGGRSHRSGGGDSTSSRSTSKSRDRRSRGERQRSRRRSRSYSRDRRRR